VKFEKKDYMNGRRVREEVFQSQASVSIEGAAVPMEDS
jgi:hypothetical protein